MHGSEINTRMDVILVTCEKLSKKCIFSFYLKPLATDRPLYLLTVPSGFNFPLNTHLQPIDLQPEGKSVK